MIYPNENNLRNALKELIEANEATLVSGLNFQGAEMEIRQVTTSIVTPFHQFYAVRVFSDGYRVSKKIGSRTSIGLTKYVYPVTIDIGDYVYLQASDDEAFETTDANFQTFGDNIVKLILDTKTFSYGGSGFRLVRDNADDLNEVITKENQSANDLEGGSATLFYYAQIGFEVEQCQ